MPRKRRDPAKPEPDPKPKLERRRPQAIGEPLGDVWPDLWSSFADLAPTQTPNRHRVGNLSEAGRADCR